MKILFIGGTGNISLSSSKRLIEQGHELWLLNRTGNHPELTGAHFIRGDIQTATAHSTVRQHQWDSVVNWIAFSPQEVERDIHLFSGITKQYIFISSASCYQNPGPTPFITEKTPLNNPFWQYSRDKIACEKRLEDAYMKNGFPSTIVRPSHTYSTVIPITLGGWQEYTTVARLKAGKPVVVQGDGTSLWTLTHADDFARGFVGLIGLAQSIGEAVHITSDEFLSWNEIMQHLAAAVNTVAEIVHVTSDTICALDPEYRGSLLGDKSTSALFDNSKIKSLVPSFSAQIPFAEGIKQTIATFEADPRLQLINQKTDRFIDRLVELASVYNH